MVSNLPDLVYLEDSISKYSFDLDDYFIDYDDGDTIDYSIKNKKLDVIIDKENRVTISSPDDWFGTEQLHFRATNPLGGFQEDSIIVTILPENDCPELLQIPIQYYQDKDRWVLDLARYIEDVDNNLSELEITVYNDDVLVSESRLVFLGSKSLPKFIEIRLSDGERSTSGLIELQRVEIEQQQTFGFWDVFFYVILIVIIIELIILVFTAMIQHKRNKFIIEEVFLIHKSGVLITHLSRRIQANVDDIIFSGMFTAVQEFIRDTFNNSDLEGLGITAEEKWALDELKLGDNKILIERSENIYLAVIFSGKSSTRLRKIVSRLMKKIENDYSNELKNWDGNVSEIEGISEILDVLIIPLNKSSKKSGLKPSNYDGDSGSSEELFQNAFKTLQTNQQYKNNDDTMESSDEWEINYKKMHKPIKVSKAPLARPVKEKEDKESDSSDVKPKQNIPMAKEVKPNKNSYNGSSNNSQNLSINLLSQVNEPKIPESIPIKLDGKDFHLDPSKSILKQLAEFDEKK